MVIGQCRMQQGLGGGWHDVNQSTVGRRRQMPRARYKPSAVGSGRRRTRAAAEDGKPHAYADLDRYSQLPSEAGSNLPWIVVYGFDRHQNILVYWLVIGKDEKVRSPGANLNSHYRWNATSFQLWASMTCH